MPLVMSKRLYIWYPLRSPVTKRVPSPGNYEGRWRQVYFSFENTCNALGYEYITHNLFSVVLKTEVNIYPKSIQGI